MDIADLYLKQLALNRYLTDQECKRCGADSCKQLVERLSSGELQAGELQELPKTKRASMTRALSGVSMIPEVPKLEFPRPIDPDFVELNQPQDGDPIIVTGNNQYTQEVLLAVLSNVDLPLFVLFSNTRGDTLDMAVIFNSFNAESIKEAFDTTGLSKRVSKSHLVIPGKAAELSDSIQECLALDVKVGPVCAAELPLYFSIPETD